MNEQNPANNDGSNSPEAPQGEIENRLTHWGVLVLHDIDHANIVPRWCWYKDSFRTWHLLAPVPDDKHGLIAHVSIEARPHYCDRGRYIARADVPGLDWADGLPKYGMDLLPLLVEMQAWLQWRLHKELLCPPMPQVKDNDDGGYHIDTRGCFFQVGSSPNLGTLETLQAKVLDQARKGGG